MTGTRIRVARVTVTVALSAALAVMLPGCALLGIHRSHASAAGAASDGATDRALAAAAERAERAVARHLNDPALRAALGRAYLRAGRFVSAADAFDDALALGDQNPGSALGLALAEIALGDRDRALQLLEDWRDVIPAADRGLALALAGNTTGGVAVLASGLRAGEGGARLRQNLAYAYALDGRWREAWVMAAQDVPARQAQARIAAWARIARPEDGSLRVAHLLGARVSRDPGYPAALALRANQPADLAAAREGLAPP